MKTPDENQLNRQAGVNHYDPRAATSPLSQADLPSAATVSSGKRMYRTVRHASLPENNSQEDRNGYHTDLSVRHDPLRVPRNHVSSDLVYSPLDSEAVNFSSALSGSFPKDSADHSHKVPDTRDPHTPQKGGETATFALQKTNQPSIMAKDRDANNALSQSTDSQPMQASSSFFGSQPPVTRKPLTPPKAMPSVAPLAEELTEAAATTTVSETSTMYEAMSEQADATTSEIHASSDNTQNDSVPKPAGQPVAAAFMRPTKGLPVKVAHRSQGVSSNSVNRPFQGNRDMQQPTDSESMLESDLSGGAGSLPPNHSADITDPYTYEWQELLAALKREKILADQPRTPSKGDFVPFDLPKNATFPNEPDQSALPTREPLECEPSPTTGQMLCAPKVSRLTPKDFSVAFGRSRSDGEDVNQEVANAFARAWAEDETAIKYDGAYHIEADAPPSKDSRAASGWMPGDPPEGSVPTSAPFASLASNMAYSDDENQLFEAYGASYAEAYAVALELEFSEEKPVPDDNTGDVTGLTSSILHTPSGEPILLGTVMLEDNLDNTSSQDVPEHTANGSADVSEPQLSTGRKVVRYLLMGLGTGAVVVAILYFAGLLL